MRERCFDFCASPTAHDLQPHSVGLPHTKTAGVITAGLIDVRVAEHERVASANLYGHDLLARSIAFLGRAYNKLQEPHPTLSPRRAVVGSK